MLEVKNVEMKRDSSLLDPNFSGYKLSLDALHVARNELADGPVHLQPAPEMYGFLHAKVCLLDEFLKALEMRESTFELNFTLRTFTICTF